MKISNLKFLDPACGCGNFLIVTFKELRKLERKIIDITNGTQKVSIRQLHGIEIEPIAAQTCTLALIITEQLENLY
jgi:type I restriction-modification system DNA methylase subunit